MLIVAVAVLPVVAFLAALWFMDRFGMVEPRMVAAMLGYGALAAAVSLWTNDWLLHALRLPLLQVSRYIAPSQSDATTHSLLLDRAGSGARRKLGLLAWLSQPNT